MNLPRGHDPIRAEYDQSSDSYAWEIDMLLRREEGGEIGAMIRNGRMPNPKKWRA
jgi:hypothetical protein